LENAEYFYKKTINLNSHHHMAYYNLGYIFQDQGNLEKSIKCFSRAAQIEPNDADSHINLGLAYKQAGRLSDAIKAYHRAILADSYNTMSYFNLGNAYQELKDYDSAIKNFQAAIAIDSDHTDALFNLGIAYQDRAYINLRPNIEDLQEALKCYEEVHRRAASLYEAEKAASYVRIALQSAVSKS
jgi:tetratricopeptide (TPR) repeat protein